MQTGVTNTD